RRGGHGRPGRLPDPVRRRRPARPRRGVAGERPTARPGPGRRPPPGRAPTDRHPPAGGEVRIVIAGAGSVGRSIANELLVSGHEVTLIDKQPAAMRVSSVAEADWLLADACELSTLEQARVEECEVV